MSSFPRLNGTIAHMQGYAFVILYVKAIVTGPPNSTDHYIVPLTCVTDFHENRSIQKITSPIDYTFSQPLLIVIRILRKLICPLHV